MAHDDPRLGPFLDVALDVEPELWASIQNGEPKLRAISPTKVTLYAQYAGIQNVTFAIVAV